MQILRLHRKPGGQPLYVMVESLAGVEQVEDRNGYQAGSLVFLGGYPVLVEENAAEIVDAIQPHDSDLKRVTAVERS